MQIIENKKFDEERALYESVDLKAVGCSFDGPADGESAFKESENIEAVDCFFNLRYPFWHDKGLKIENCTMTELCRAALWYTENAHICKTKMHGIKALRECKNIVVTDCDIISPEFGWSVENIKMSDSKAVSEYFMMRSTELDFSNVELKGKYSFQYIEDATFNNCIFDTKDAFWHSKNVTVYDSVINGEYLAWYSEGLTLINCKITGIQPFCYCKNLKLINCEMYDADLCFEKSEVEAQVTTPIISIKNPAHAVFDIDSVGELILDGKGTVEFKNKAAV